MLLIIQDATTPADTSAAIERAGLGEAAYTLRKGEPLPTLLDMIEAEQRLLVFAEQGGPGAPAWYMPAYDWFQETGYSFRSQDEFNCSPNRGSPDNPLFLLNHWVSNSPPNPSSATAANRRNVLEQRAFRCLSERGRIPNVVALDFAERGDGLSIAPELADSLRAAFRGNDDEAAPHDGPDGTDHHGGAGCDDHVAARDRGPAARVHRGQHADRWRSRGVLRRVPRCQRGAGRMAGGGAVGSARRAGLRRPGLRTPARPAAGAPLRRRSARSW